VEKVITENGGEASVRLAIKNTDRSVGAMLLGEIARQHGNNGFAGSISAEFDGCAGQSFGVFVLPGASIKLNGGE